MPFPLNYSNIFLRSSGTQKVKKIHPSRNRNCLCSGGASSDGPAHLPRTLPSLMRSWPASAGSGRGQTPLGQEVQKLKTKPSVITKKTPTRWFHRKDFSQKDPALKFPWKTSPYSALMPKRKEHTFQNLLFLPSDRYSAPLNPAYCLFIFLRYTGWSLENPLYLTCELLWNWKSMGHGSWATEVPVIALSVLVRVCGLKSTKYRRRTIRNYSSKCIFEAKPTARKQQHSKEACANSMRKIWCPSFFKYTNFYIGTHCSRVAFFPGVAIQVWAHRTIWGIYSQTDLKCLSSGIRSSFTLGIAHCKHNSHSLFVSHTCLLRPLLLHRPPPALHMYLQELLVVRLQLPTVREKIRSVNELPKIQYNKTVVPLKSRPLHASKTDLQKF